MFLYFIKIRVNHTYLAITGGQREFTVTDKYMKKMTIENWCKPCIWLNNQNPLDLPNIPYWQREYLLANCIFVNLEHRMYQPEPIIPSIFHPPPSSSPSQTESLMEGPSRIPLDKGKGREIDTVVIDSDTVYLEDLLAPGQLY